MHVCADTGTHNLIMFLYLLHQIRLQPRIVIERTYVTLVLFCPSPCLKQIRRAKMEAAQPVGALSNDFTCLPTAVGQPPEM